ncbi:MAG: hypothetical protein KDE53_12550 [Caldilineaceae bacterium]|nr:hypothetical protein [Caldilineaceae bacterium]MCB0126063.1 hypothetical protein [Caldilineaceae bacterium]
MTATPGRPTKPDGKKRKQLHLSLYTEDIERLDQLTNNRSEFVRQLIEDAWQQKMASEVKLSITVPPGLLRALIQLADQHLSAQEKNVAQRLVKRLTVDQ